ncbi:TRAP transporter small permease [Paenibacillus sp. IB182496]|uniref:TRAP transporter small permease n=1 Tax=Paenibacillus sabuli TaxID=2772509 RepID=A0A927GPT0_9BACL|nr:TRAP transporter small permease [Paenibacillus sabuli]MBD2843794.1 TRAP transporter small permease [Paenibacillus sabuli]
MKLLRYTEEGILAAAMLTATLLVCVNVALRAAGGGITWSEEAVRYLFILITFLGVGIGIREGAHFSIDLIPQVLKGRSAQALATFICLVALLFSVLLAYYGWRTSQFSMETGQRTPSLRIPIYVIYGIIPVSGILMALRYAYRLIRIWRPQGR